MGAAPGGARGPGVLGVRARGGRSGLHRHALREGRWISESMEGHGLTTPVALRMLRVGERTGQMGEMMDRIAGFHDEEMARWVDWITKLIEPLPLVAIGVGMRGLG